MTNETLDDEAARRARRDRARSSYLERLAQVLLGLIGVASFWAFARWIGPVLNPVIVSLLIAYLLDPVVDRLQTKGVSRTIAISFIVSLLVAALAIVLAVVMPVVTEELGRAMRELPAWSEQQYAALSAWSADRLGLDLATQLRGLAGVEGLAGKAQAAVHTVISSAMSSVTSLLNLVLIPIFSFYFLRDFDTLKLLPLALVPPRYRDEVVEDARRMDRAVGDWVRGQVHVALVLAVLYSIGLTGIGLKLGVFIGVLSGLLNVVPYLGAAIGIGLSVVMALIYGGFSQLIGVGLVFFVVQMFEGYLITPRLVGQKVGMSPLMVMLVLLVGGSLFGFFGMLLAIPVTAAGAVVARQWFAAYQRSPFYARPADPPAPARPAEAAPPGAGSDVAVSPSS